MPGIRAFFILMILLTPKWALGAERTEFFDGIRSLGMGGATVAVVDDETALYLNPAALGRLRDHFITVVDPLVEAGQGTQPVMNTGVLGVADPQKVLDNLNEHASDRVHTKVQVSPSLVFPNFGVGLLGQNVVDASISSDGTKYRYHYLNDYAAVIGANLKFFSGIIKLGVNARIIDREEINKDDLDPAATDLTFNSLVAEGVGIGSDVGLIMTAPVRYLPTLSAVWRDVGGTSYGLKEGILRHTSETPDHTPSTVDVGLAIFPITGRGTRMSWTLEYQDVLTMGEEKDQWRRVHAGVEWNIEDSLFLRAGLNQRYWTAGLEIAVGNYQLQAATYGEEVGTPTRHEEDRRYLAKFAYRF